MTEVILFVFGTLFGSFLNVVGLRWDLSGGLSRFGGRSKCPHCGKTLTWYELVPIVSFLILRGKCRDCKGSISYQYPFIEILTGLVFATVPLMFIPVFSIYIVILIYDIRYKIIPDTLVYTSIVLSFLVTLLFGHPSGLDWLAGPILFLFFGSIWFFSGGRAMGFGDAKLGLSVGLLLGLAEGISAMVLAFWIGATFALIYMFLNKMNFLKNSKSLTMKSEVPFAPFIILGAWISTVFSLNIFNVSSF